MGFLDTSNPASYCNIGNISICFYTKYCYGQPSQSIPSQYVSTYQITASSGSLTEVIKSTCLAYYNPASTASPLNKTTLDTLTNQFGLDYSNWKKVTFDYVFAGICNLAASGLNDVIEFDYLSEKKGCFTRVYSYPLNYTIKNLGHFDYSGDCVNSIDTGLLNWDAQPYRSVYGPPSICSGGQLQLTRYGIIFMDGRLQQKYISTDIV
jgi:hypothetical protein